jgi:hypothetical protein
MNIGPWEPHPLYPRTEIRKDTETGEILVTLFPEGREGSTCWVWTFKDHEYGSKIDPKQARMAADVRLLQKYFPPMCEVFLCREARYNDPEKGPLCVCQRHHEEILRGERRFPPIRKRRDYQSMPRKTIFMEYVFPDNFPAPKKE